MIATGERPAAGDSQWFASWFDSSHYHKLYGYRDEAEAARFVDALVRALAPADGATVLDLGCGAGRHARQLGARGLRVTGIDLSARSIAEARLLAGPGLRFFRHDMRQRFGRCLYDYVLNLFTSFGYFDDLPTHERVVANIARSLKPGGRLVLDYLNVRYAERRLVADETVVVDAVTYRISRWSDDRHFFKRIMIDEGRGTSLEHVERVARFTLGDFHRMFADRGLAIEAVYGDYSLHDYDSDESPRLILVGRKRNTPRRQIAPAAMASSKPLLRGEVFPDAAERLG